MTFTKGKGRGESNEKKNEWERERQHEARRSDSRGRTMERAMVEPERARRKLRIIEAQKRELGKRARKQVGDRW